MVAPLCRRSAFVYPILFRSLAFILLPLFVLTGVAGYAQEVSTTTKLAPDNIWRGPRVHQPKHNSVHILPYRTGSRVTASNVPPNCIGAHLSYFDGPLLSNVIVVPVFWNSNVNSATKTNISQFYSDVTVSPWQNMLLEYSATNGASGSDQSIGWGTAVAGVTITPVVCPASTTTACNLTDAQLQTEIVRQINLGNLPQPLLDGEGFARTIYMVHFPANIRLSAFGASSCVAGGFCAYHGTGTLGASNEPFPYGAIMDTYTGGCSVGCGGNATGLANQTEVSSHELGEAITDTDVGLDFQSVYAFPAAWGDNNCLEEIADICDSGAAGDTITVSGRNWTVQELWSNAQNKCTSTATTTTATRPSYQFTIPSSVSTGSSFNFTLTMHNPFGNLGTDNAYIGTVHFTSSDGSATLPADYTFTPADLGTKNFSATLQTSGSQTITANTVTGTAPSASGNTTVGGSSPIASITPVSVNFGKVVINTISTNKVVTLANTGTGTLNISNIGVSGSAFSMVSKTCGTTLIAGAKCKVTLNFSPTALGTVAGSLTFTDNAPNNPQMVPLSGTGVLAATLTPTSATYASQTVNTTSLPKTFTLTNNQTVSLNSISISRTGDFAVSATTCTSTLAAKGKCTISVTFTPTAIGTRTGTLTVSDSAANNPQHSNLKGTGK